MKRPSESTKQREKRVAKKLGGRQQPASGATPWAKEDIITDFWLIQHKEVQEGTKSHTIKWEEVKELRRNAIDLNRYPVYMIDVLDHKRSYYMIDQEDFETYQEWIRQQHESE